MTSLQKQVLKRLVGYPLFLGLLLALLWAVSIRMPGDSFAGVAPPLTRAQDSIRGGLTRHVAHLATQIGERNATRRTALDSAAAYIDSELRALGYDVVSMPYAVRGQTFRNLEATLPGARRPGEIVLVGGHYDSVFETPGADDNASGIAGMLELARLLRGRNMDRTVRFVGFVNEEPPFFWTEDMGSLRYARAARSRGDSIVAMLSLETIGYYIDTPGSQKYPPILGLFYPSVGNFVGFVGNIGSRRLVHDVVASFRRHAAIPSAGSAAPKQIPGIGWSDQWSFWKVGYPGVMVTSTAPYRNPHYHNPSDTPEKLDYVRMTRVVDALVPTIVDLASQSQR